MSDVKATITRGKGEAVVVEVELKGKLKDPKDWPECLEKLQNVLKGYGTNVEIKQINRK